MRNDVADSLCDNRIMANEWIGERLRSLKKNKSGLARALGVDPARVSEIIGGRRNVQVSELPRMAEILEMPPAQLIELLTPRNNGRSSIAGGEVQSAALPLPPDSADTHKSERLSLPQWSRSLPIFGAETSGCDDDNGFVLNGDVADYAERPPSLTGAKNAYGVYVQNDSMAPRFEIGWLLLINPSRPVRKGDNVVIQIRQPDQMAVRSFLALFEDKTPTRLAARQLNRSQRLEWSLDEVQAIHRIVGVAEM